MLSLIYADGIVYENNVENWIRETQEKIEDWKVMSIYLNEDIETQDCYGYYFSSNLLRMLGSIYFLQLYFIRINIRAKTAVHASALLPRIFLKQSLFLFYHKNY